MLYRICNITRLYICQIRYVYYMIDDTYYLCCRSYIIYDI